MNFHQKPGMRSGDISLSTAPLSENAMLEAEAFALLREGKAAEALQILCAILEKNPDHLMAHFFRAQIFSENNHLEAALVDFDEAILIAPDLALAHYARGVCLLRMKKTDEAFEALTQSTAGPEPETDAWFHLGNIEMDRRNFGKAVGHYKAYLEKLPGNADVHINLVIALKSLGAYEEALVEAQKIHAADPDNVKCHETIGVIYLELGDFTKSLDHFKAAKEKNPKSLNAWLGEGQIHTKAARYKEALESFGKLEELFPESHVGFLNCGQVNILNHSYKDAVADYEKAIAKDDCPPSALGDLVHVKRQICDWEGIRSLQEEALDGLRDGKLTAFPFNLLAWTNDAQLMKKSAELFCERMHPLQKDLEALVPAKADGRKIRVGYFSADFSEHATMILMARFFEIHDKSKFELFGFSFGPERMDYMRIRAEMAFDHFMDVRPLTDRAVALLARYFEIDIAIDLKGYTTHSRPNIFAYRAAPVQINYLGFPGTMGANYMDYIIADDVVIPPELESHFSEKVLRLPRCYQVNDSTRTNKGRAFTRSQLGLPEDAFVFCSFNNNYKIDPEIFDVWCRLLQRVENSVLWIMADSEFAKDNLIKEAASRGIAADRLIFTPRCNQGDHISRQAHGDLLLDTFPCNAHTTASDALFAGLPVLTIQGETFASRVAASILTSAGLHDLVTDNYQAYEERAYELATDRSKIDAIKERLRSGIATSELYDTVGFARDFEALLLDVAKKHDMI